MSQSSPSRCVYRVFESCSHHIHVGATTDEKCASCMEYVGRRRGLGDVVHSAIEAIVPKKILDKANGCNCGKRRAALNDLVPFDREG